MPQDEQEPEREPEHHERGLRDHQDLAALEPVGDEARDGDEEQLRRELQRHGDADGEGVGVGEFGEHHPVLGCGLHPGTDVGDEGADEPDAVVTTGEGAEHGTHWVASPPISSAARASTARSSFESSRSRTVSHASRFEVVAFTSSRPASVRLMFALRRSMSSATRCR